MIIHEPPLFDIISDEPNAREALGIVNGRIKAVLDLFAAGDLEKATQAFMENIAMGTGSWEKLTEAIRKTFIHNAPTWYDEMQDPQSLLIDVSTISNFRKPVLLSTGSESPPFFPLVIEKLMPALPHANRITIDGAGHVPHMSHSAIYVDMVSEFCLGEEGEARN